MRSIYKHFHVFISHIFTIFPAFLDKSLVFMRCFVKINKFYLILAARNGKSNIDNMQVS